METHPKLIEMLARKAGLDVTTPRGAEFLCHDIETVTGERIGVNTVKRIVGIFNYQGSHREMILDIIARYLDFPSWKLLEAILNDKTSGFSKKNRILDPESLRSGQEIAIYWEPGRKVTLRHGEGRDFTVVESINSKLKAGDELSLSQLAPGFPFYASNVKRGEESMGHYTAATVAGISRIELI